MAKIIRKSLDSIKRAPIRKNSYEAPIVRRKKKSVPKEYQTLKKASGRSGGWIWFVFFVFLATLAGWFYWSTTNNIEVDNSLEMIVTGPSQLVSGDQASYVVKYKNLDIVPLQQLELDVIWPSGFYFDEANIAPHDTSATTWFLDDLAVGGEVELTIKGQLVGQKDEELSAAFNLQYQPENFTSNFKAKESVITKISDNKLELAIEAIDKTLVATEHEIILKYKNISSDALSDLHLDIIYPDNLEVSEVEPIKEGDYWVLSLEPDEEQTISIKGSFSADSKSQEILVTEVGNLVDDKFRPLARLDKEFTVVNPQFTINLEINGEVDNQSVDWGEVLRYQMEITNDSESELTDVQIMSLLDGETLDWESLETIGVRDESKIVWSKEENKELGLWPAGESRIFTWQLKIVDEQLPERNIENIIKITLQGLADWEQVSTPVVLTVGEGLVFNNGIYWHLGGRRVGSGLLPPQVGEDTEYLVVWSLAEAVGSFDTVLIETILPPEVEFISETDVQGGELSLDDETKALSWSISDFADEILPTTASFMIELTPGEEHLGSAMTLLNAIIIAAAGEDEVLLRSKLLKTTDVVANTSQPIGIVE